MESGNRYQRILLKLSGEALSDKGQTGVSSQACLKIGRMILEAYQLNVQIGIVIGGGNFIRGSQLSQDLKMPLASAHHTGMIATVMNGLILQQTLNHLGCPTKLMTSFPCTPLAPSHDLNKALEDLNNNQVVIFSGGTGNPFFTTDTAASLRACEIGADVVLKATKVDGVYDKDPLKHSDAKKFESLSYQQVLEQKLEVMDAAAISLCRENQIPIIVFNMYKSDNLLQIIQKTPCGTIVKG